MKSSRIQSHLVRAALATLSLGAFHCMNKPMEPVMPTWDVNVVAPVANRTYTMGELAAKDPSLLQTEPGGTQLYLKTSVEADPTYVGDRISLEPMNTSFYTELGSFSITSGNYSQNVQLPGFTPGMRSVFPPMPPTDVAPATGELPFVEWMTLESGNVEIRLWNRMPFALRIENPVELANEGGAIIGSFDFGTTLINAGESRTAATSLAGKTVNKRVRLNGMRISSPGSGTSVVTIPDTMLLADIVPYGLLSTSARLTNIASQQLSEVRELPMTTETLVRDVWLNRGTLGLHLVSGSNLSSTLQLRLPELLRPSGVPYEQNINLGPRDSVDLAIDLAGYRLHSLNGAYLHTLRAECIADLAGSNGQAVTVTSRDFVSARVVTSNILADSALAALKPTVIAIDERISLDLGELSKKFHANLDIPAAELIFTPRSTIVMPMELQLRFEAKGASGNTVTLDVPVTKSTQGLEAISFAPGDVGKFLTGISGSLPDSLRVTGSIVLNPDYDTTAPSRVGRNCSFAAGVDLSIPMSLRIADGHFRDTLVLGDTTGDGTADKRIGEDAISQFNYGQLFVQIDNGLPLAVKLKVGLLDRTRAMVLAVPQAEGDSIAIAAGSVMNGDVVAAARSTRTLELKGTDLRQFNLADLVKIDLALATGGSMPVNFRTTDQVRVKMWTQFSYRVNP